MMTTVKTRPTSFTQWGQLVSTAAIAEAIKQIPEFLPWLNDRLLDYSKCRWGDTSPQDKEMNDLAIVNGDDRVVAMYRCPIDNDMIENVYVITEWDRSVTTVMFTSEY